MLRFDVVRVFKEQRFAIEREEESGKYYITFPVFNGMVEYAEFYLISDIELANFMSNYDLLFKFVKECKDRKCDERLLHKPGRVRGEPV